MKKIKAIRKKLSGKMIGLGITLMSLVGISAIPCSAAAGTTTLVNQSPMDMTEGINVFESFVAMLWSYITTAVAWILTPAMWILLVPFLAYMSVIAASVLKSLVKGA